MITLHKAWAALREREAALKRLAGTYDLIDKSYDETAAHYGFSCSGCTENCCTQRFFHHTLIEYFFLFEGMKRLDAGLREKIIMKARDVVDTYQTEAQEGKIRPLMCPANFEGLCVVYQHRPLICRSHGLPHEFTKPDKSTVRSGGCNIFNESHTMDMRIDRTRPYTELAMLEREIRIAIGFGGRYSKTTAQMIVDMATDDEEGGGHLFSDN